MRISRITTPRQVLVGMSLLLPILSSAVEMDRINMHGFVSQGYLLSTANDYLVETDAGSAEFSEAAVNFFLSPDPQLRLGIQLLSRNLGDEGNHHVTLDWGFADYRWQDWLGFRVGVLKSPSGVYNKTRDFDMLRVPILMPSGVYSESNRDFHLVLDGIALYGNRPLLGAGSLEYELQAGARNVPDYNSGFWNDVYRGIGAGLAAGMEAGLSQHPMYPEGSVSVEYQGTEDRYISLNNVLIGDLAWKTPLEGLKLAGTYLYNKNMQLEGTVELGVTLPAEDPNGPPVEQASTIPYTNKGNIHIWTIGIEWAAADWTFASEYQRINVDSDFISGGATMERYSSSDGWYGMITYELNSWSALSGYYSERYGNTDDRDGAKSGTGAHAWQKDLTGSIRFDLTSHWLAKFELHYIDGLALVDPAEEVETPDATWLLFAVKSTIYF